ncbi:MAG: response regulator, partial [Nitrospirae bacterium]|nr:response regulator [Nitrospirota bacterium]
MSTTHRIMIIDDEKIVGDMAKLSVEQEGYEVETFLNAAPALERLKSQSFDVVVTDY